MQLDGLAGKEFGRYSIIELLGEGAFGITYKARDNNIDGLVAIKILKKHNSNWKEEAQKAAKLRDIVQAATIYDAASIKMEIDGKTHELDYIVSEYVDGVTLGDFLKTQDHITATFIIEFVREMCTAIGGMRYYNLEHNDLIDQNIMLVKPKEWGYDSKYKLKIIDFGLAKSPKQEAMNDMGNLAHHLQQCLDANNKITDPIGVKDRLYQNKLALLANKMTDPNEERRLDDPNNIMQFLDDMVRDPQANPRKNLEHPFDFLSVELIPENSTLIQELYVDIVPWLKELESNSTVIISGPRGSGKSMVLKNMRFLTKLKSPDTSALNSSNYMGIYMHCPQMLHSPFSGLNIDYDDSACNKFIHYFNLIITSEMLTMLIEAESKEIVMIENAGKIKLANFLKSSILNMSPPELTDDDKFNKSKILVEKEILICQKSIQNNVPLHKSTPIDYLKNLFAALDEICSFFADRNVYILLDDYSTPKINKHVQKSINRIIGYRNSKFCFKITSEQFGFVYKDQDGKNLEHDREFTFMDLGYHFVKSEPKTRKKFIKEIFNKRIEKSDLPIANVEELFESEKTPKISDQLCNMQDRKINANFNYAGFDMLYKLCIGDVSTLLQLCKKIFDKHKTENNQNSNISIKTQNDVIRKFSKERFNMIKTIPKYGTRLHKFVEEFGNTSQKRLLDSTKDKPANEILRIELTGYKPDRGTELCRQLIANNIFVSAGMTYPWSVGKNHSIDALILRPIFTPALQISYNNRNALRYSWNSFNELLDEPEKISKATDPTQQTLDNDVGDEHGA